MSADFVELVGEEIDACDTISDMFAMTNIIHGMRQYDGIREVSVPAWRKKARRLWPEWETTTVVAVDLNQISHMSFSVKPDRSKENTLDMLRNVYSDLKPGIFTVAADCRRGVVKKYQSSRYKGGREASPPEYYEQLDATIDALRAKVPLEMQDGMEADDCLATIAFQCALIGSKCILVATDRDLWQALFNGVAMYDRHSKEFKNNAWLMAHHRIKPSQVVDWLCMVGGKNDLPGVSGVGEKRASDLLEAHGDFIGAMNTTRNPSLSAYFKEHYWDTRPLHSLSFGCKCQWFMSIDGNK